MGCEFPTLLDILDSQQLRTVILVAAGLDISQIANLLGTSVGAVRSSLNSCLHQAGCQSANGLVIRLRYEFENGLYDGRLEKELGYLQDAAKRFLDAVEPAITRDDSTERRQTPRMHWLI